MLNMDPYTKEQLMTPPENVVYSVEIRIKGGHYKVWVNWVGKVTAPKVHISNGLLKAILAKYIEPLSLPGNANPYDKG